MPNVFTRAMFQHERHRPGFSWFECDQIRHMSHEFRWSIDNEWRVFEKNLETIAPHSDLCRRVAMMRMGIRRIGRGGDRTVRMVVP